MKALHPDGQPMRLLRWLRANPGSSSYEITVALRLVNVTGRVSDLRSAGYVIECIEDKNGVARYRLVEPRKADTGEQLGWTA